jgi:hypothetical protein
MVTVVSQHLCNYMSVIFFRNCRTQDPRPVDAHLNRGLNLNSMIDIGVDVAKGCAYLEKG